ncbi:hypothetical protein [Shewanella salipaludis]|uniref:Lipoprotein n=1 Tax=Shewanella salipaludis TaxID=2723052 RepID=A0A972JKI6_9GAMM|nr:hypothetical protein [Shewanella salipaludis]NMH66230.1 hypothetical protein [Shewanella salipaludis]
MKIFLKIGLAICLTQLIGCTSSKAILYSGNKTKSEIVTVYVPQQFIHVVNGNKLAGTFNYQDGHFVELIYLDSGHASLQGTMSTNFQDFGSKYKYTEWSFKVGVDFKAGHTYMLYWEEYNEKPVISGRDLGELGDSFSPIINEFGFVEGGRQSLIERQKAYYESLINKGSSIKIINEEYLETHNKKS